LNIGDDDLYYGGVFSAFWVGEQRKVPMLRRENGVSGLSTTIPTVKTEGTFRLF